MPRGLDRRTYATILKGKTPALFNVYRPYHSRMEDAVSSTMIKQQWTLVKQQGRNKHPHQATITYRIKDIKSKQKIIMK